LGENEQTPDYPGRKTGVISDPPKIVPSPAHTASSAAYAA